MVPVLGIGTAPLGSYMFTQINDEQAAATVNHAVEREIGFFDTSPAYGYGLAERRLGKGLQGVPRDRFVVQTKVELVISENRVRYAFDRENVMRSLDESLKRLQLDRVDILLLHDIDYHYREALESGFPSLAELRSQGVVKAIGVGLNQWQMLVDLTRHADFDCYLLAHEYTLLRHISLPLFDLCLKKGISIFPAAVFNSGILATGAVPEARFKYRNAPEFVMEQVRRIETVCQCYDVPLRAAAMQFSLAHPAASALVIGMNSPQEVDDNLLALQFPIPKMLWEDLRREGLISPDAPTPD